MAKKNVLLMIADDLGRDLSVYGQEKSPHTPNLEKLASQGSVFENAFASTASCSGSRSTIYTGLHTHQNGQYGLNRGYHRLHYFTTFDCIETQPAIFNRLGYSTQIIGKLHVGPPKNYPFSVRDEGHARDVQWLSERFEEHVDRCREQGVPFFTTIGFADPHRDSTRGGWANNVEYPRVEKRVYDPKDVQIPSFLSDLPDVRKELAEYYQAIDRLDQGVGIMLDILEQQGVTDSTLVVFLSDNGPPFVGSKATLYDAGVKLPLVVRRPNQKRGIRNPNLVSYLDLLPTFLDWCGYKNVASSNPKGTERIGRSLLPILELQQDHPDFNFVFGSHTFHETSSYYPTRFLRTKKYKYHRNVAWQLPFPFGADLYASTAFDQMRNHQPDGPGSMKLGNRPMKEYIYRPPELLFDIENDPDELINLANRDEYNEVLSSMRAQLEEWQRATGDQWLFRDGLSIGLQDHHIRAGLRIPDRFDFDPDKPGNVDGPVVKESERIVRW